jgi:hypothetical protein
MTLRPLPVVRLPVCIEQKATFEKLGQKERAENENCKVDLLTANL